MSKIDANQAREAESAQGPSAERPAGTPRSPLPDELRPWLVLAYGDSRDELRAALSAGADATDDLVAIRCALVAVADEEGAIGPEDRQRALQSASRLLRERTALLHSTFDFLWTRA